MDVCVYACVCMHACIYVWCGIVCVSSVSVCVCIVLNGGYTEGRWVYTSRVESHEWYGGLAEVMYIMLCPFLFQVPETHARVHSK